MTVGASDDKHENGYGIPSELRMLVDRLTSHETKFSKLDRGHTPLSPGITYDLGKQ